MRNAIEQNGLAIVRTPKGIGVAWTTARPAIHDRPIKVEVYYGGRLLYERLLNPVNEMPWRDYYGQGVDHLKLWIRAKDGETILAELSLPPDEFVHPFMVVQGEQRHITENYISVPPALHITDDLGAVWTLGFTTAPKEKSPNGEFAFDVLRDGARAGVIASRIERRNGKIRAFTRRGGWVVWNGNQFL